MKCLVIGDANIDYVVDLATTDLRLLNNPCIHSNIKMSIGGNGVFFSEAALEAGFHSVALFCSLGHDLAGKQIIEYCDNKKISIIMQESKWETGKALILYQPNDTRVMIADRGANSCFNPELIDINNTCDQKNTMIYVSGYMLKEDNQSRKISELIKKENLNGVLKVLDLVPHDIYKQFKWDEYYEKCKGFDCIVMEYSTVLGFANKDSMCNEEIAIFLLKYFEYSIVRINNASDILIASKDRQRVIRIAYSDKISSLRYTDRVLSHIAKLILTDNQKLFEDDSWVAKINLIIGGEYGQDL